MIKQPLLVCFACLVIGALSSCSTTPTMDKSKAEAIAKKKKSASKFLPQAASAHTIAKAQSLPKDKHGMPKYSNVAQRTHYVRTTAYSHMENEVGAPGRMNAAGGILKYGSVRSAAADWSVYPLGTTFKIKGLPHTYVVDDYGSALVGTNTVDIFKPSLRLMNKWGTRKTEITVIQWGSFKRSLALLKGRTRYHHCRSMYNNCKHKMRNAVAIRELEKHGAL